MKNNKKLLRDFVTTLVALSNLFMVGYVML